MSKNETQQELVITRGAPGSGKSTYAIEWVSKSPLRGRVNRDNLRLAMFGKPAPLPPAYEKAITAAQQSAVSAMLRAGKSVIVDDCHTNSRYVTQWKTIADKHNVGFRINDSFAYVPVDTCINRDAKRELVVGEEVIRDMHKRLLSSIASGWSESNKEDYLYTPNPGGYPTYLFDIDGTLAIMGDRSPYDWKSVGVDTVNKSIADVINTMYWSGTQIILLSGRDSVCRDETVEWLTSNKIEWNKLFMRKQDDMRKDYVIKLELFREHVDIPENDIWGVFDDRPSVCRMWRSIGLQVFQVADPEKEF